MGLKEESRSDWLVATLGPWDPGVMQISYGATTHDAEECRLIRRPSVITDEMLTFGLKGWSRGQKSQAASTSCSGGVSAVIGSSDLVGHTFHPSAVHGDPS